MGFALKMTVIIVAVMTEDGIQGEDHSIRLC